MKKQWLISKVKRDESRKRTSLARVQSGKRSRDEDRRVHGHVCHGLERHGRGVEDEPHVDDDAQKKQRRARAPNLAREPRLEVRVSGVVCV